MVFIAELNCNNKTFESETAGFDTNTVLRSWGQQKLARDYLTSKSEVPLGLLNFEEKHDYEFYCNATYTLSIHILTFHKLKLKLKSNI